MNISRRNALSLITLGTLGMSAPVRLSGRSSGTPSGFRYCLNTSTISGRDSGLLSYVEIASGAGYEGIEVWVSDVKKVLAAGMTTAELSRYIEGHGLRVENAIGFAPWLAAGDNGFRQMEEEMEILAAIGCNRIAAPPAGLDGREPLDLFVAGKKYRDLLALGRKTGVMPQLEFWGASPLFWHLGQALMIASVADDPDARILSDVFHLFRGGSGFNSLKMMNGSLIEIFHMNDYPASGPDRHLDDADRVYPGDGVAPLKQILTDLERMGGEKVLSLELFNRGYWEEDPVRVARTGLEKMRSLVNQIA